jgi:hypothetical protein
MSEIDIHNLTLYALPASRVALRLTAGAMKLRDHERL